MREMRDARPKLISTVIHLVSSRKRTKMNKQSLVEKVNDVLGTTKVQAEQVVDTVFATIVSALKKGDDVSVAGFGIFTVKKRAARTARNPKTGATVQVPATKVAKFKPAKALKEAVA